MLGENLLISMWETLTKSGIGSLLSPWQIKRQGKAHNEVRKEEILMLAQAENDANDIRNGNKKLLPDGRLTSLSRKESEGENPFALISPIKEFENLSEAVENKSNVRKIQQEININKTILLAEEELLRSEQAVPDEEIDIDWIHRWHDYAKNTQNDELRNFWARTLAGEVKQPGSYSLRTLEFIKNLSQNEALSISQLGQFIIGDSIIKCGRLEEVGINFSFLLKMDELGVVSGVQGGNTTGLIWTLSMAPEEDKYFKVLINRNLVLIIKHEDPKKQLRMDCFKLSQVGMELLSLGDFNADAEFINQVGEKIKESGFLVQIADWAPESATGGRYYNEKEI